MANVLKYSASFQSHRSIFTSAARDGKRNFRKFFLHNKRGSRIFKQQQTMDPDPEIPIYNYGVRRTGYMSGKRFVHVPEMVPDLIVPDLTDFKLKPYVSYKVPDVIQSEFTAKDLFDAVYSKKILEDFKNGKLDANGNSMEPNEDEKLTPEEAKAKARRTGSDIFACDKL
ncbi:large ribosomal subunit protein mL41 [Anabrus simplex]|uniref:large ribosomal subunit protein mL41 n=1 Tax=Anabrus simplex TaxID=316456 RepID=UPI0034DD8C41